MIFWIGFGVGLLLGAYLFWGGYRRGINRTIVWIVDHIENLMRRTED